MKNLLGISLVALFAVSPMMANATAVAGSPLSYGEDQPTGDALTAVVGGEPLYQLAQSAATDVNAASAGYVKGAYNAAIKAVNKVHQEVANISSAATNALQSAGDGLTKSGTTVSLSDATKSSLAKADTALQSAGDGLTKSGTTVSLSDATKSSLAKADTALQSHQAITEGATNGTISVAGTDVAVHGLGSAAYAATTDFDAAGAATSAASAVESKLGAGSSGYDIDANTLKVKGKAVLTDHQTIATGATNGTISVAGTDVAVSGLGTAAYAATTDFDAAGAATSAASAVESKLSAGNSGYDIDAKTLKVQGADVLTSAALSSYSTTSQVNSAIDSALSAYTTTSALQSAYATKSGVLATIGNASVSYDIMRTWGSDDATSATYSVSAPASYVAE